MNQSTEYRVTHELRSSTKLSSRFAFYAKDGIFLMVMLGIVWMLQSLVAAQFKVIYWIISITLGIVFIIPSPWNPKRKIFATAMLFLTKDNSVFYPMHVKKRMVEKNPMNKKKKRELQTSDKLLSEPKYNDKYQCFEQNYGFMNILQIISKDIVNASEDEIVYDIAKLTKYNKLEYEDYKILSLNFPCNTMAQQDYIKGKIKKTANRQFEKFLNNSLYELEWVQDKKSKREFYLQIFSESGDGIRKMEADMKAALQTNDRMIEDMSREKKETILFRLSNPASILTGGM